MRNALKNTFLNLFILNFVLCAITEIVLAWIHSSGWISAVIANVFCLLQFIFLSIALYDILPAEKLKVFKKSILFLIGGVIIFSILSGIFINESDQMDAWAMPLESIVLFFLAGVNLIYLAREVDGILLYDYKFWFLSSTFIYFCISTIIFSTGNILLDNKVTLGTYTWVVNLILTILSNCMYYIGIRCLPQKKN